MSSPSPKQPAICAAAALAIFAILSGCDGYDSDYFPYAMKGLNVWVYNNSTDEQYFGGFVEGSYISRSKAVASCASRAGATARQHHLEDWSFICCTVTSASNCVTKVR